MNRRYFYRLVCCVSFLIVMFAACKKNKETQTDPSTITLYTCNANSSNMAAPYICFDSLITNSLCPEDAVCFWSGAAIIKISFHENGNTHRFNMILPDLKNFGAVNDTTVNGYRIVFKDIQPHNNTSKPAPMPEEIKAVIEISR